MIVWAAGCWQEGAGLARLSGRDTTSRVNPPLCQDGSPARETIPAPRITQFSMDRRKGDALSARNEFSAEVRAGDGLGLDYRGWMGDTRGSWRERGGKEEE